MRIHVSSSLRDTASKWQGILQLLQLSRSADAVTHVYVFCESLQRYVLHDEATYMNNKTAYEPGRTAYARMKK